MTVKEFKKTYEDLKQSYWGNVEFIQSSNIGEMRKDIEEKAFSKAFIILTNQLIEQLE